MGSEIRWENNFIKKGQDFEAFWKAYLIESERNICLVMGIGFDPRTNSAIKKIFSIKSLGKKECIAIRYKKHAGDAINFSNKYVNAHTQELEQFLNNECQIKPLYRDLISRSDEDRSIASINASKIIEDIDIQDFSDIIVDISAMPRSVFLPILNKILNYIDKYEGRSKNLHIVVAENPDLDSSIQDKGIDEQMSFPHGFRVFSTSSTEDYSRIWIPILGEGQLEQFKIINKELEPVAVCPVLPFPSSNLRRGDNLINYYQDYLFNDPDFEPNNIIYADEQNPFQVYRLLNRTIEQYHNTFNILGGCKILISTLSSKLLTVGAFLAVYEAKKQGKIVGIAHVESIDHNLEGEQREQFSQNEKMYELWITGEPYEK